MNQTHALFPLILLLTAAVTGLLNGCLLAGIFGKRRFWIGGLAGAVAALGAVWEYLWYAQAYTDWGFQMLAVTWIACAWFTANLILLMPLFLFFLVSRMGKGLHLIRAGTVLFVAAAMIIGIYGNAVGGRDLQEEDITLEIRNLPASFDGFRIAFLADTHIGPYYTYADLDEDLFRASQDHSDMVALGGDLIDDIRFMPDTAQVLKARNGLFPYGICYVWGNHEYYKGKQGIDAELEKTGVKILTNDSVRLKRGNDSLYIAGVDFPWGKKEDMPALREKMTAAAFSGIPDGSCIVLLAHHSDFIKEGLEDGAALVLTGHTHGTQLGLFGRPLLTPFVYTRGLFRGADGGYGYVSRGTGQWFPFRFGCSREMTVFTLRKAAE